MEAPTSYNHMDKKWKSTSEGYTESEIAKLVYKHIFEKAATASGNNTEEILTKKNKPNCWFKLKNFKLYSTIINFFNWSLVFFSELRKFYFAAAQQTFGTAQSVCSCALKLVLLHTHIPWYASEVVSE